MDTERLTFIDVARIYGCQTPKELLETIEDLLRQLVLCDK